MGFPNLLKAKCPRCGYIFEWNKIKAMELGLKYENEKLDKLIEKERKK